MPQHSFLWGLCLFSASIRKVIGIEHVKFTFSHETCCLAQKYRAHAKGQIQKVNHKDVLAQASRVLGEAGMEIMLRKLGNVDLQAMLAAREMANSTSTAPDELVRADFFAGLFLGPWAVDVVRNAVISLQHALFSFCLRCLAHCDIAITQTV